MAKLTTGGISSDRIKNASEFERTRENMAEFGRAGKAAKLLRTIFKEVTVNAKDKITHGRLVKVMSSIILTDQVNERGARTVNNGNTQLLMDFQFNRRVAFSDSLSVRHTITFNRVSGEVVVTVPAFVPRSAVKKVNGMTHYRIMAAAASINFDTRQYEYAKQGTPELPFNNIATQATTFTLALPANSTNTVVAVLGIEYVQLLSTGSYALKSGEHTASNIVLVDKPV